MSIELVHELLLSRHTVEELGVHVKHLLGALNHQRTAVNIAQEVGVPQLDRLELLGYESRPDGVEPGHEVDSADDLVQGQPLWVHRVKITLLQRALKHQHPGPVHVVGAVHALRDVRGKEGLQHCVRTKLLQTGQQFKINANLFFENIGLKNIHSVGIICGQKLGNEGVVLTLAVRGDTGVDLARDAHVARADFAVSHV